MNEHIHTSRNVVFDEVLVWWSSKYSVEPNKKDLEAKNEVRIYRIKSEKINKLWHLQIRR